MAYNSQLINGNLCDATEVMSNFNQLGILADATTATGIWLFNNPVIRATGTAATLIISSTSTTTDSVVSFQRNYAEKWKVLNEATTNNFIIHDVVSGTGIITISQPDGTTTVNKALRYRSAAGGMANVDNLLYRHIGVVTGGTASTSGVLASIGTIAVPANTISNDIWIFIDYYTTGGGSTGQTMKGDFFLEINGTTARTWYKTAYYEHAGGSWDYANSGTLMYRYAPTAAEKSSGFNVIIFGMATYSSAGAVKANTMWITGN